jgi:nicotinate-nucleotide pyrophosphorylase (carboxylating)
MATRFPFLRPLLFIYLWPHSGKRKLLATVTGRACDVMRAERVVLNLLSRSCGIALKARRAADEAKRLRFLGALSGTRKTTPGFRLVEKQALLVGGVDPHRMDLSSMVMLKDNHIASAGGDVAKAVAMARAVCGFSAKIEVECGSLEEALRAGAAGANVVMLDNMTPAQLKAAARQLKAAYPAITIECSGGITPETMRNYFCPHIDILSMGCLTQGVPHVDVSLKINPTRAQGVIRKRRSRNKGSSSVAGKSGAPTGQ